MIHGMTKWGSRVGLAMIAIGCGGSPKSAASAPTGTAAPQSAATTDSAAAPPPAAASASAAGAGQPAPSAPPSASAATAVTPPPPEHPFAKNAVEATSLIDDAINSRVDGLGKCVDGARARRKSAHEKLVVEVGIDEEGHMLGVQLPKHEKKDPEFVNCVIDALHGAPFPRSHAGVITVRKTFEDKAVYR
jgi:hypothetical protein